MIGRKALADKIRELPFEGVTGHLEFTETGDLGRVSITIGHIRNQIAIRRQAI